MKLVTLLSVSLFSSILLANPTPKLLLLKTYKDQNTTNWVMSEKLDGIRAYWDGNQLLTRSGKKIYAPKWFTKDYPNFEIDGELWTKRGDFENISSIVRDKIPSKNWSQIKHYIFEVPNTKGGLFQRLEKVKPYENDYIKILPQILIRNIEHQKNYLKEVESKNGEGIVVRDSNVLYINKRTSKALKVKSFKDTECKIVGFTEGNGKYLNKVGAIICQLSSQITFKIGSGMDDKFRNNPPKIGTIVTFKYQNFTKYGKPRFPIYLRIRKN
ncbi:DNA ligase [Arcobacteraceae bacterium]|nr:DNA ligase [Arcobacteraceae bacterium]